MKKLIFLMLTILAACQAPQNKKIITKNQDKLTQFFQMCESDINNAKKVILEHEMVKNLSHLQNMNNGGRKYYLLERETLTKLIKSVTQGIYEDFILINKKGVVIYTMKNDEIFSKNVLSQLRATPLNSCYRNRNRTLNIEDVSRIGKGENPYSIFISIKVKGKNAFPGIFVLQIPISKINTLIEKNEFIVGKDGKYKIAKEIKKINMPYEISSKINFNTENSQYLSNKISYRIFQYSNLVWALLTSR